MQEKEGLYDLALASLTRASDLPLSESDARSVAAAMDRVSTHILQEVGNKDK